MIGTIAKRSLKALVAAEVKATGRSIERISRLIHGDTYFLNEFFAGKCSVTIRKFDEMEAKLRKAAKQRSVPIKKSVRKIVTG